MIRKRKFLAYSLCATLGLVSASQDANATCANLAGKWHFFGSQGTTPNIQSVPTTVDIGNNVTDSIIVFPKNVTPYENNTSNVIECTLTVLANGSFTGSCSNFGVSSGSGGSGPVSGSLTLASCNLSGTINTGDPNLVTIRASHINGYIGAGIATQGSNRVLHFTMVKN
jgi:hypothetical protein